MTLSLHFGDWHAELRPEIGGAIAGLWHGRTAILREMPADAAAPLESACFPLVPWCNRIRGGRFRFAGCDVALPANFPPEPHSLHGLGWQRPWRIESRAGSKCVLADEYDGSGPWPWAYRAEQRVRLGGKGCAITVVLTNRADRPMPAGLGLHPYFRRTAGMQIRFAAEHVLSTGTDPLPTGKAALADHFADFAAGARLPRETIDHCFTGWCGAVTIEDAQGTIAVSASGAPHLHLYAPADGSALCCEPVSHTPDAPNRAPAEMIVLPPGCSATLTMRISAWQAAAVNHPSLP